MAIQFISDLPQSTTLNSFNNNEVTFRSTRSEESIFATITIGSFSVSVTPNKQGVFHFNFKEAFKIISNANHFQDGLMNSLAVSTGAGSYVYRRTDPNVFRRVNVAYSIEAEDGSIDHATRQYKILRSVIQLSDYRAGLTNEENHMISILSPMVDKSSKTYHATKFDGYPFEFSLLSNRTQHIIIKNKTTEHQITIQGVEGVNRIILSTGISNVTLENILPITNGINEIEIAPYDPSADLSEFKITLFLTKKQPCKNGHLLKWFCDFGGWCYYFFQENAQRMDFKEVADYPNNYGNIGSVQSAFTSMGYEKEKQVQLYADQLSRFEKRYINTLFGSPKVYLYLKDSFQLADKNSFVEVKVSGSKADLESRYLRLYDFLFDIYKPYDNPLAM